MSNPTPPSISVIGDLLLAIGANAAPALAVPDGYTLLPSGDERIAVAVRGAVRHGVAADGTHWLALADLVAGDPAEGTAAYAGEAVQAGWRGRFAQLLWQPGRARLVAVTDHFSTLPLYVFRHGGDCYLASDLRLLAALPQCARTIDKVAVYHYLNFGCIPAPHTICREIAHLEPGTRATWDAGTLNLERYFLPDYPQDLDGDDDRLAAALRERIVSTVHDYRPESEAAAWGCFLSGGTDSSSIVSILARQQPKRRVRSFSIGFAEAGYDELDFARLAAEACGAEPSFATVGREQTTSLVESIVRHYDQPFGNASAVPTLACADLARRQGVDVLLAGDGGDEIFGGNQRYAKDWVMESFYRLPAPLKALGRAIGHGAGRSSNHFLQRVDNFFRRSSLPNPDRFYTDDSFASDYYEKLLTPAFRAEVGRDASLEFMRELYARGGEEASPLHRIMRLDLSMAIAQNDLVKVHGACKASGVSVRYPYVDPALVAYTGRLPARFKVRRTHKRYLFKRAMAEVLPEAILRKKKQGFGLPIAVWLRSDAAFIEMVKGVLFDARARARGWFEPACVEALIEEHMRGSWDHSGAIWQMLVLELWLRRHLDGT
ncbi:asparagine synthase C-terminal domain-containing protein [Dokdonella sp.]|uniref:asparagine synthetase B family protein n=1 Tax=Dokdonella sp. TaxID=2291710 RepID=UPI001B2D4B0B|nr:asparagine synthase C-terminal domain-containing protein [Dokdonella sp.]MBO9661986.1 hypothetical protein [Dokdonella sp.]